MVAAKKNTKKKAAEKRPAKKRVAPRLPAKKKVGKKRAAKKKAPAPAKNKRRMRTSEEIDGKLKDFLERFARNGNKTVAAKEADVPLITVKHRASTDNAFKAQVAEARALALSRLEEEARRRAMDGTLKAVYYKGEICGHEVEYSDSLMRTLLAANNPEKYARRRQTLGADGQPIDPPASSPIVIVPAPVAREDWATYAAEARAIQEQNVSGAIEHMREKHGDKVA